MPRDRAAVRACACGFFRLRGFSMHDTIRFSRLASALFSLAVFAQAKAKPIAFANGTTIMAEYGAGTMEEAQAFYAPYYWLSLGAGFLRLDSDEIPRTREIGYLRANFLARRWNLEDAQ